MEIVKSNLTAVLKFTLVESLFLASSVFTFVFFGENLVIIDTENAAPLVVTGAYIFSGVFGLLNADIAARVWLRITLKGCETALQLIVSGLMTLLSLVVASATTAAALTENFAGAELSSPALSMTLVTVIIFMSVLQVIGGVFLFSLFSVDSRIALELAGAVVSDHKMTIDAVKVRLQQGRQERVDNLTDAITQKGERRIYDVLGTHTSSPRYLSNGHGQTRPSPRRPRRLSKN